MRAPVNLLLTALVLTLATGAIAQVVPPSRAWLPVALLLDSVPFAASVIATVIATRRLVRDDVPLARLLVAAYVYLAGTCIATLGVAHLTAVFAQSIERVRQSRFLYDFRLYSLVLLGVALIAAGVMAAVRSASLARGSLEAWRASLAAWTTILAINLPLAPLQTFAVVFSGLAALALLWLGASRRHFTVPPTRSND